MSHQRSPTRFAAQQQHARMPCAWHPLASNTRTANPVRMLCWSLSLGQQGRWSPAVLASTAPLYFILFLVVKFYEDARRFV